MPKTIAILSLFVSQLLAVASVAATGEPPSTLGEWLEDSELHDVCFRDVDRGFSVGDRGVIWETIDGGRRWRLVDSPTTSALRSIHFVDDQHGWIVGGWIHPGTHRSSAVVLRTENGGQKWTRVEVPTLPAFRFVRFVDAKRGWAVGDASALFGCGIFSTQDGGYTWTSAPRTEQLAFATAALLEPRRLLLIARDSAVWQVDLNGLEPVAAPDASGRRVHAVEFDGGHGWLVGDAGLLRRTLDGGRTWQAPPRRWPEDADREFDLRTVCVRGEHCWIAGSPGTRVWHSADGGHSWRAARTGQNTPIRRVHFVDEQHGWCVGSFGRILATRDGGESWRVQRSGGERASLLTVQSEADRLPLELLAQATADAGQRAVATTMFHVSQPNPARASVDDRTHEAARAVGASTSAVGWQFDARHPPTDHIAIDQLEADTVRQIRLWRPDVIVTDPLRSDGRDPVGHLVGQIVLRAAQRASDPAAFPDQIVLAGLQPWTVRRVFGALPAGETGGVILDLQQTGLRLGCSLADFTTVARAVLHAESPPVATSRAFRLLTAQTGNETVSRDLFAGIPAGPSGEARRETTTPSVSLESLSKLSQRQRNLREMAARGVGGNASVGNVLAQVDTLTQGLDPHAAGRLLWQLSELFRAAGRSQASAEALVMLLDRAPDHAMGDAALMTLLHFHGSAEIQATLHRDRPLKLPAVVQVTSPALTKTATRTASFVTNDDPNESRDELATPRHVVQFAKFAQQTRPALYAEPSLQFSLLAAHRQLKQSAETVKLLNILSGSQLGPAWKNCVRGELWLANGKGNAPRPTIACKTAAIKPMLNGVLEEPVWETAVGVPLDPAIATDPQPAVSEVRFLGDDEFLYFGVHCWKNAAANYEPATHPRQRDLDWSDHDHVTIWIDVERDYATAFSLSVDHRGWGADRCDHDARWNPRWFIAATADESQWHVEAAIPWTELGVPEPSRRGTWNVAIERTGPPARRQIWPLTADTARPETWGYLLFK